MKLRALWTVRLLAAEGRTHQNTDCYADGEPDSYVAGHHSEHRAQRRS